VPEKIAEIHVNPEYSNEGSDDDDDEREDEANKKEE